MSGHVFDKYLRREKLPHMWCPGCGNGIVTQALLRAIEASGADQDEVVIVSGVGCSSRANGYLDFCGIHTTHGRPVAFATGVKMANPRLKVIVVTGDGDCTSIGGNHFIHAARRNIDLTVLVYNNSNYGMTGGQYSPTTPPGAVSKTSPLGNIEPRFDVCELAGAAGATYVARSSAYHVRLLIRQLTTALKHDGFAVVEAMCDCPTLYGRLNRQGDAAAMLLRWKETCLPLAEARGLDATALAGRVVIGEFVNGNERPEYTAQYEQLIKTAQQEARA